MADEASAADGIQQAVILKAARGAESIQEMLEAIAQLEKQRQRGSIESLEGEWLLIWTSGTEKYQKLKPNNSQKPIQISSRRNQVVQRFDIQQRQLENEVKFPFGSLVVAGKFEYTPQSANSVYLFSNAIALRQAEVSTAFGSVCSRLVANDIYR